MAQNWWGQDKTIDAPSASGTLGRTVIREAAPQPTPRHPDEVAAAAERLRIDKERLRIEQARFAADQPKPPTREALHSARVEAARKINAVRGIRRRLDTAGTLRQGDILPETGPMAMAMASIGWPSNASDMAASFRVLQKGGSLAKVVELMETFGKNPFTPMSNYESELLSGSIGDLDFRQSPQSLKTQLDAYEDLYTRAYHIAGGNPKALVPKGQRQAQPQQGQQPQRKPSGWRPPPGVTVEPM